MALFENNGLTIGEQCDTIHNFYNALLTKFRLMMCIKFLTSCLRVHANPPPPCLLRVNAVRTGSAPNMPGVLSKV